MMRYFLWYVIVITSMTACRRSTPPGAELVSEASSLPPIQITAKKKMLFTYSTEDGAFESVDTLDKVPEGRRGWVRVVDLSIKPEQRHDHELVYVADLRSTTKDGSYPFVVMSREAFEAAAVGRAQQGATDPAPQPTTGQASSGLSKGAPKVILYSTSWCGACRSARTYLTQQGIPYVEKDIEKDSQAANELLQKAKAAGISASGVPVLDVNGTLMQGFNPARLKALLGT